MKISQQLFRIGSLALAVLCLVELQASAYTRAQHSQFPGTFLYWYKRTITYSIAKDSLKDFVSFSDVVGAVKRSFFSWASPSCTDISFIYGGVDSTTTEFAKPDGKNLIVWHKDKWPPVDDPAITNEMPAVTTLKYNDKGIIAEADIDLNAVNFFWTTSDKPQTDIQNVMTHEIGHLLGLDHTEAQDSAMYSKTFNGETKKQKLSADDQDGVCFIYPFSDTTPMGPGVDPPKIDVQGGCAVAPAAASSREESSLTAIGLLALVGFALRRCS
jgi:MYXO-CTERM domain-containing protein